MNRRDFTKAILASVPIGAELELKEPKKPALAVLKVPEPISYQVQEKIVDLWQRLFKGVPPCPLMILQQGMELEILEDPRQ